MIQKITIENFKCFKSIELENVNQVNIITGKNSGGKTALLEAIFAFHERANGLMNNRFNNWRGINSDYESFDDVLKPLFRNCDFENDIRIKIADKNNDLSELKISYKNKAKLVNPPPEFLPIYPYDIISTEKGTDYIIDIVELAFNYKRRPTQYNKVYFGLTGITNNLTPGFHETKKCAFISTKNNGINSNEQSIMFSDLIKKYGKEDIIKVAQVIEPRITDIVNLTCKSNITSLNVILDNGNIFPVGAISDGLYKLLNYVLHIIDKENGILLIDEIENGIHYSIMGKMWNILLRYANQYNCQLFVTTHSYELLANLISEENNLEQLVNCISYYNFAKNEDTHDYYYFSFKALKNSLSSNWEVR